MKTAVQLHTLRKACAKDLEETFRFCAEIGLDGVELSPTGYSKGSFWGKNATEVRELADKYGLEICSALVDFPELKENLNEVIQFQREVGNTRVVVPYISLKTPEMVRDAAKELQPIVDRMKEEGIEVYWHNHGRELKLCKGRLLIDMLLEQVKGLKLEMDTFWAYAGGQEPKAFLASHAKYMNRLLHVKDGFSLEEMTEEQAVIANGAQEGLMKTPMIPCVIGKGELPIEELIHQARELGIEWCILENDLPFPNGFEDVAASVKPMTLFAKC